MLIALYVLAAVAANLLVYQFGPWVTPFSAFVLIGFNMTSRDALHERWRGRLRLKMGALILGASAASWILNPAGGRIALASGAAFLLSELVDAGIYQAALRQPWLVKTNVSNVGGAAVDSIVFPTLAFGVFLPGVIALQFIMKVFGGAIWAFLLRNRRHVAVATLLLLCAVPGRTQIISGNVAWMHTSQFDAPVAEVFVAAPPVIGLRAYGIASFNLDAKEVTYLTRVGKTVQVGPYSVGVGAGAIWLKFLDYKPKPSVSASVFGPPVKGFRLYSIAAYEKTPEWGWTAFVGITHTFYFRR